MITLRQYEKVLLDSLKPTFLKAMLVIALCFLGGCAPVGERSVAVATRKIIAFGGIGGSGGNPSPPELVSQIDAVARFPVDGFVFNLSNVPGYLPNLPFSEVREVREDQLAADVECFRMARSKLGAVQDNFVRLNVGVLNFDWFDDAAWAVLTQNLTVIARAAQTCGAVGFMLDTEQYGYNAAPSVAPFDYNRQKQVAELTFAAYRQQVRKRGAEFGRAITAVFPTAKFFFTFATSYAFNPINAKALLSGLEPAFVDGLMDGAPQAEIIDGYEGAYYFKTRDQFVVARELIKERAAVLSADPARYRRRMQVAFGIYVFGPNGQKLASDFIKNSLTPVQYEAVLRWALELSDGYVWIYAQPSTSGPPEYIRAIARAKAGATAAPNAFSETTATDGAYTFFAKEMRISNTTPSDREGTSACSSHGVATNWFIGGEYVALSATGKENGVMNCTGAAGFSPVSNEPIPDGLYQVIADICHSNVKKDNSGDPPADRNGSFAYRLRLADQTKGSLAYVPEGKGEWISHFPQDPDNGGGSPFYGTVALTNFVAYGPDAADEKARVLVRLKGVCASNVIFELWDQVLLNYGTVGLKSLTLIPVNSHNRTSGSRLNIQQFD